MLITEKTVQSISELIKSLSEDTSEIEGPIWYRGHYDKEWKLVPEIFRNRRDPVRAEIDFLRRFKQDATLLLDRVPTKQYEWLLIMRHHGVPTRLLDWTESPLIATYFAVTQYPDKDGALWALLPLELNKEGDRLFEDPGHLPSFEEDNFMDSYSPEIYVKDRMSNMLPIAFIAPRNTQRMRSQLSVFTINHRNVIPIEEIGKKEHVWRYIITSSVKTIIIKELDMLGIRETQLFPELEHIGLSLKGK